jgi:hypothetical protein
VGSAFYPASDESFGAVFQAAMDVPNSIAHMPVPVPMSSTFVGSVMGAKKSLPWNRIVNIACWMSDPKPGLAACLATIVDWSVGSGHACGECFDHSLRRSCSCCNACQLNKARLSLETVPVRRARSVRPDAPDHLVAGILASF